MGPLNGLRALEIGERGEVAGKLLADAGTDVIRVEPPGGAGSRRLGPFTGDHPDPNGSLRYRYFNTNKRGVTLDVAAADGQALWRRLVGRVDLVIDSSGPGALDRLEAGYGTTAEHARLIWCSITPFGLTGPWRDWAVTDLVSMALGGPMSSNGYDDHSLPPIRPEGEHSLWVTGEYAVHGVLAALLQRCRTGQGQLIDVSIHEAISATTEGSFANWEYFGQIVQRQTGRHASVTPTSGWQHRCRDGAYINLVGGGIPRTRRGWEALLAWMDSEDAVEDLHDPLYQEAVLSAPRASSPPQRHVQEVIGHFVQRFTAEEAYRHGQALHLSWGIVRRPEENLADPHWQDRGFFLEGELPGHNKPVRFPGAPYRFSSTPVELRRRAPLLGEHNHEVFAGELGLSTTDLINLSQVGVI